MKTFEVEFERISYVTLAVEASSLEEAEAKAWAELEEGQGNINDAQWAVCSIEESETPSC